LAKSKPEILVDIRDASGRIIMPEAYADLCIAFVRLAAIQVRIGLVAAETAAFGFDPMRDISAVAEVDPTPSVSHAELDAAIQVLKGNLLAGREAGFRNVLRVNFPDDEIKAMAEAILVAARRVRAKSQPPYRRDVAQSRRCRVTSAPRVRRSMQFLPRGGRLGLEPRTSGGPIDV
jgi:hypothetical protein